MKTLDKAAVSYQIVLTKADQVKPDELAERTEATATALAKQPQVVSTLTGRSGAAFCAGAATRSPVAAARSSRRRGRR